MPGVIGPGIDVKRKVGLYTCESIMLLNVVALCASLYVVVLLAKMISQNCGRCL